MLEIMNNEQAIEKLRALRKLERLVLMYSVDDVVQRYQSLGGSIKKLSKEVFSGPVRVLADEDIPLIQIAPDISYVGKRLGFFCRQRKDKNTYPITDITHYAHHDNADISFNRFTISIYHTIPVLPEFRNKIQKGKLVDLADLA
jgi:hypothetical protein